MKLDSILNNKNNIYFLHGPGTDKQTILDSIMNYGIRCGHGIFQFTSIYHLCQSVLRAALSTYDGDKQTD